MVNWFRKGAVWLDRPVVPTLLAGAIYAPQNLA
jgi:hypothetical protein